MMTFSLRINYGIIFILVVMFCCTALFGQQNTKNSTSARFKIDTTIRGFLKWHKIQSIQNERSDISRNAYRLTTGGYPDTTKEVMDMVGVELYVQHLRLSGYFSDTYLELLRGYFKNIGTDMAQRAETEDLVAINGLNSDWILKTMEPEMILDHIDEGKIDKLAIIDDKAIARFHISKEIQLLFTLTKLHDRWLIDYIGCDSRF